VHLRGEIYFTTVVGTNCQPFRDNCHGYNSPQLRSQVQYLLANCCTLPWKPQPFVDDLPQNGKQWSSTKSDRQSNLIIVKKTMYTFVRPQTVKCWDDDWRLPSRHRPQNRHGTPWKTSLEDLEAPFWIIQTPETIRNLPDILKIACIEVSLTDFNIPNLKILYVHHVWF
jgi:hypothetical protein